MHNETNQRAQKAAKKRREPGDAVELKRLDWPCSDAALYFLHPPLRVLGDEGSEFHSHVVVSAVGGRKPETLVFPADADGNVAELDELVGSYRGGANHAVALAHAGYRRTGGAS